MARRPKQLLTILIISVIIYLLYTNRVLYLHSENPHDESVVWLENDGAKNIEVITKLLQYYAKRNKNVSARCGKVYSNFEKYIGCINGLKENIACKKTFIPRESLKLNLRIESLQKTKENIKTAIESQPSFERRKGYVDNANNVNHGGWLMPDCRTTKHTAIIIPYRNRNLHLLALLQNLYPVLYAQQIHVRIFVIEQMDSYTFNRAKLLNVGFVEALKYFPYNCFIFHDVDLIPENINIDYACGKSPMHLSVGVSTFGYALLYEELFGGVSSMTRQHFESVNGYSNSFWNWGGEDDNMYYRLRNKTLSIQRQPINIARYKMLSHKKSDLKPLDERRQFCEASYKHISTDGLSSLQYKVIKNLENSLFTLIRVDLMKEKDKLFGRFK